MRQLIMQCCDRRVLLRLARCSRFTHTAASDPFAWRHAPPMELRCQGISALASRVATVLTSLPRQGHFNVSLYLSTRPIHSTQLSSDLVALATLPRLAGLVILAGGSGPFDAASAATFFDALRLSGNASGPTQLRLRHVELHAHAALAAASLVASCPRLQSAAFASCTTVPAETCMLIQALQSCHDLQTLCVVSNRCDSSGVEMLAASLRYWPLLTGIMLVECHPGAAGLHRLFDALPLHCAALTRVNLSGNEVSITECDAVRARLLHALPLLQVTI